MLVKHWSSAGFLLTWWCGARCASCYLCCGPERGGDAPVEFWLSVWRSLIEAGPHGCRVHLTGGEPFGDWDRLIALCVRAKAEGLGPLEKVETNAFWATQEGLVRERLRALDAAGMGKLVISTDPCHQQYVPISRCRMAARVGLEVLGAGRVQVRWRDWLAEGFDTSELPERDRRELFARWASSGRDRMNGRAAARLAPQLPHKSAEEFADSPCRENLLRCRHVHISPEGWIIPGVCSGIVLGRIDAKTDIAAMRRRLAADYAARPIVGALVRSGPAGLLEAATAAGYTPREGYAGKCHLCREVRAHLAEKGLGVDELEPAWMYLDDA